MLDRRTSLSTVLSIVMMVAAGYAVVLLGLYAFQSRLVYFPNVPSRTIGPGPESIGLAYEPVEIITEDGIKLDAWYVPVREPRGTVLFFHGNAGNISHRLDSLKVFNELNLATLIFDYRGYGRSEGEVSEQGIYRDAEAVWRHLTEERGIEDLQTYSDVLKSLQAGSEITVVFTRDNVEHSVTTKVVAR